MRFEIKLAWRHLIAGGGQTVLTIFAVAIAAMVVLFVQITISGMQTRLTRDLVGSLSHVTIKPADTLPDGLEQITPKHDSRWILVSERQPRLQQRTDIGEWKSLVVQIAHFPGVRVATATVSGSAVAVRGSKRDAVTVTGGIPKEMEAICPVQKNMLAGKWLDIIDGDVVIGIKLAEELRLKPDDRLILHSSHGEIRSYKVAGIFYAGNASDVNQVYVTLRAAQSLLATGQSVSMIQTKLTDAYRADQIAAELAAVLPYKVDSWMTDQASFLNALKSQDTIRVFLTAFVLLASSVAVAAIMIVSVLQKNKQIGILKSMGARDQQIRMVFTLEGLGVAVAGAIIGMLLSVVALNGLGGLTQANPFGGRKDAVFTIIYDPVQITQLMLIVIAATVLAAVFPAWKASRLNPVEVIRG